MFREEIEKMVMMDNESNNDRIRQKICSMLITTSRRGKMKAFAIVFLCNCLFFYFYIYSKTLAKVIHHILYKAITFGNLSDCFIKKLSPSKAVMTSLSLPYYYYLTHLL